MNKGSDSDLLEGFNELKSSIFNQNIAHIDTINRLNSQINSFSDIVADLFNRYHNKIAQLERQNEELKRELKSNTNKLTSCLIQSKDNDQRLLQQGLHKNQQVKKQDSLSLQIHPAQQQQIANGSLLIQYQQDSFQRQKNDLNQKIAKLSADKINKESSQTNKNKRKRKNNKGPKMKQTRLLVKQQLSTIEHFARVELKQKLKYNDDHRTYQIPKKFILVLYDRWCCNKNRKIMIDNMMIVQMSLTNHLKKLFPLMDSSTGNYRGLLFQDSNYAKSYRKYPQLLAQLMSRNSGRG